MNEIIIRKARIIESYLLENYEGNVEICGEDDEINTIPAKRALNAVRDVLAYLEQTA